MQKKHSVIARLSKEETADLLDLQRLTGRRQADALRFAVRTTAQALRVVETLQARAVRLPTLIADEVLNVKS